MKLIVVNDGAFCINAEIVTKVQNAEGAIYIHTQDDSEEVYLVGRYKDKKNTERAFRDLRDFITSESNGCLDITDDEKLRGWECVFPDI